MSTAVSMSVLSIEPLGFPWITDDPFLFCVHHLDNYPAGNSRMGIDRAELTGRDLGADFSGKDGYSMYHGHVVPGFPRHPHRGFETISLARRGFIDHSDSLGATARFGHGDVQWMTAGRGIVHSEMFPLLNTDADNPMEMFQIWLNLPRAAKMVDPYFAMLWAETIATVETGNAEVTVIAGQFGDAVAPAPPPDSWAANAEAGVEILSIRIKAGGRVELAPTASNRNRSVYFFAGSSLRIGGREIGRKSAVRVRPDVDLVIGAETDGELLVLGGKPIGEPVAARGPFVMNEPREIIEAYSDYRATEFGGWPWQGDGPVHARDAGRFAIHADGRREEPT